MTEQITREIFNHLVDLAAFELDPQEAEYLRNQLNNQLLAVHELAAIPMPEDTPLAAHGVTFTDQISQGLRPDVWQPCTDSAEIIDQVPVVDGGYVVVPEIPHTTLE